MQNEERRCWAEVDLHVIRENYRIYKSLIKPGQEIMAVVKADAYGHGDREVALALSEIGCRHFAVSNIQEAIRLRDVLPDEEILILGYTPPACFDLLIGNDITQAVLSEEYAEKLAAAGSAIKCHFVIDTGMNRIGLDADEPEECERIIRRFAEKLDITGLFTHLCCADSELESDLLFTEGQIAKFRTVAESVQDLSIPEKHCLNTAGGLWHNDFGNLVRLGISLYGLKPDYENTLPHGIRPALSWKSVISMVKEIKQGEYVGYRRTFQANKPMLLATITAGYADGLRRALYKDSYVLIRGQKAPIVGRVCMDQMMADVTHISGIQAGDSVTFIGTDGKEEILADELAQNAGTIGYEVVCGIGKRVDRIYL